MLATVHVALISVAARKHELGEPEVENAAVRALGAPVLAQLLHQAACSQAGVFVEVQEAEVEALDLDGGCGGAEGGHSAPRGGEAFDGVRAVRAAMDSAVGVAARAHQHGLTGVVGALLVGAAGAAEEALDWEMGGPGVRWAV